MRSRLLKWPGGGPRGWLISPEGKAGLQHGETRQLLAHKAALPGPLSGWRGRPSPGLPEAGPWLHWGRLPREGSHHPTLRASQSLNCSHRHDSCAGTCSPSGSLGFGDVQGRGARGPAHLRRAPCRRPLTRAASHMPCWAKAKVHRMKPRGTRSEP